MLNHVMMDIETLSNTSNSLVVSISCVQFDLNTGEVGEEFEAGLNLKTQMKLDADLSIDTVMWWMTQEDEARNKLVNMEKQPVARVLKDLNLWFYNLGFSLKDIKLWGNGATFDNVIVRNLYQRHGVEFTVPFWCDNDVRTLVTLAGIDTRNYEFTGTKHNAIDDCKHQIKYCCHAASMLKGVNA